MSKIINNYICFNLQKFKSKLIEQNDNWVFSDFSWSSFMFRYLKKKNLKNRLNFDQNLGSLRLQFQFSFQFKQNRQNKIIMLLMAVYIIIYIQKVYTLIANQESAIDISSIYWVSINDQFVWSQPNITLVSNLYACRTIFC